MRECNFITNKYPKKRRVITVNLFLIYVEKAKRTAHIENQGTLMQNILSKVDKKYINRGQTQY